MSETRWARAGLGQASRRGPFLLGLTLSLATWGGYFSWLWPRMFFLKEDGLWAGTPEIWADWAAHLAYANVFAYRSPSAWFSIHPLFAGERFNYPFVSDGLSGLLIGAGVDPVSAFVLPSIAASLALVVTLYTFYAVLLGSPWLALLAQTLFFASGGLDFIASLQAIAHGGFDVPLRDYAALSAFGIRWLNVVGAELLPQRAMLFGLPVALAILITLARYRGTGLQAAAPSTLLALSVASVVLLATHPHSFLAVMLVSALMALFDLRSLRTWLLFAVSAGLPSAALFAFTYGDAGAHSFAGWQPGWLAASTGMPLWLFLWINWGVFLPLALASLLRFRERLDPFVLSGLILFVVCFLVRLQPHAWDNTKLLTWAQLLLCAPVAHYLGVLWARPQRFARIVAILLVLFATASGGLELWQLTRPQLAVRMWSSEELQLSAEFRTRSGPVSVVASAGSSHHWVSSLSGRPVLLGYPGWLWSYGFDYVPIERDVQTILRGGAESEELIRRHGVEFVVIGPIEREDSGAESYFRTHHDLLLEGAGYTVFRVAEPRLFAPVAP
jgi:hypothetical protein